MHNPTEKFSVFLSKEKIQNQQVAQIGQNPQPVIQNFQEKSKMDEKMETNQKKVVRNNQNRVKNVPMVHGEFLCPEENCEANFSSEFILKKHVEFIHKKVFNSNNSSSTALKENTNLKSLSQSNQRPKINQNVQAPIKNFQEQSKVNEKRDMNLKPVEIYQNNVTNHITQSYRKTIMNQNNKQNFEEKSRITEKRVIYPKSVENYQSNATNQGRVEEIFDDYGKVIGKRYIKSSRPSKAVWFIRKFLKFHFMYCFPLQ